MRFLSKQFFLKHSAIIIPGWFILLKDVFVVAFAFSLAYTLRYNFRLDNNALYAMYFQMVLISVYASIIFSILGVHNGLIRHTGLKDAILIVKAVFILTCTMPVMNILNNYNLIYDIFRVPHSIIILFFTLSTTLIVLVRGSVRLFYNWLISEGSVTGVLICGAGKAGLITKNVLTADQSIKTRVVGFVDEDPAKTGKTIEGLPVYPTSILNPRFLARKGVTEIIFAINNISNERKNELIESLLIKTHLKVKNIPPVESWINGELSVKQIKTVKITELLQRSEIVLNKGNVQEQLEGKRLLVTGAAGSIGSEIVRQLLFFNPSLIIMVDQDETAMFHLENEVRQKLAKTSQQWDSIIPKVEFIIANIGDHNLMNGVFSNFEPQVIYHAAAYKHVPMMERNPFEAVRVNVFGTKNLADLAVEYRSERFVMVSTDKAVNPTNVMGATKRAAEIYIQSLNYSNNSNELRNSDKPVVPEFISTRFGNVLGSNGSVIPLFEKQIARGGPVTVTHPEITRYFMTIPEACQLVLEAGAIGRGGEILMFDMGKPVKISDLACNMIRLSGLEPHVDIPIIYTGLRPGEKLYEELLYDKEKGIKTHHPKISIAAVKPYPPNYVNRHLSNIKSLPHNLNDINRPTNIATDHTSTKMQLIAALKSMIPEYKSNNSIFRELEMPA